MKSVKQGMALITVLLMAQIFILLSLCALRSVGGQARIAEESLASWQLNQAAQMIEKQITANILAEEEPCIIPVTSAGQLHKKSKAYWQSAVTCSGNLQAFQYYYVIEKLSEAPCVTYDRVSLKVLATTDRRFSLLGQTVLVKNKAGPCPLNTRRRVAGRLSWREIF